MELPTNKESSILNEVFDVSLDCGFAFNMDTGSNRSFLSRFKLHCKICKSCNEKMKSGTYKQLIEQRLFFNKLNTVLKSM